MPTAEMQTLPYRSAVHAASRAPYFASASPGSRSPVWMTAGVICIAAASLGASLAYMWLEESPPAAGYAIDRDWALLSPLGLAAAPVAQQMAPVPVCTVCGRVEAVSPLAAFAPHNGGSESLAGSRLGRKPLYQVSVRMADGQLHTLRWATPLAVGTAVTLEQGVLRVSNTARDVGKVA